MKDACFERRNAIVLGHIASVDLSRGTAPDACETVCLTLNSGIWIECAWCPDSEAVFRTFIQEQGVSPEKGYSWL